MYNSSTKVQGYPDLHKVTRTTAVGDIPMIMEASMDTPMNILRMLVSLSYLTFAVDLYGSISGKYSDRDLPDYSARNFKERGFTIGIGG